jgi:hypothetical protein
MADDTRAGTAVVSFEDSVKARLKGIVAELIPESRWDELVKKAVVEFEQYDLPKLVKAELIERYKAAIQAEFAKPEWGVRWGAAGPEASEAVRNMLIEAAPAVLASMIGSAMQSVTEQLKYTLQNQRY